MVCPFRMFLDGQPEQTPGKLPEGQTPQTGDGNYVVLDIGNGRFAFYAHMQPGPSRSRSATGSAPATCSACSATVTLRNEHEDPLGRSIALRVAESVLGVTSCRFAD